MTDPETEKKPDLTGHPETIGPYRIVRVLGEGGMGIVYAAEQTEPVRRRVALKLVRGSDRSEDIANRFSAERQALAVMEHPAIAQVYDAGVMEDGSPYFVMEYIDGTPIVEYCDAHQVSTGDRLRMFIQVCSAIQHAHQKGLIHRDLKPGNILITEQAGTPLPKVIDFGIAKAMDIHLSEQTFVTQAGQIIGTPAYMAPEQADSDGIDIDTRADVYALGVILYELLVGRLPLDPDELGFLPFLAKLVMRQTNPPTPSARLITLADEGKKVASQRHTNIEHLRRDLRGDLDWVTMKAIEPERERRYETALALADDLNRHLVHEPVTARPPSKKYRVEKFVRRNRGAVLAGVLALLALVGGTITTAVGMVKASRAEQRATTALAQAERDATTSREVADFLVGLFNVSQPGPEMGGRLTARELLDRGVERIEEELASQPEVQGRLMSTMGRAYFTLGFYDSSERLHRRAVEVIETALGPNDRTLVEYLTALADAIPHASSNPAAAASGLEVVALTERGFAIQSEYMAEDTTRWIGSLSGLAWSIHRQGDFDRGVGLLDSVRMEFERELGPNTDHDFLLRDLIARININEGRHEEAVAVLEELLADSTAGGEFWIDPRTRNLRNNLANAYGEIGRHEEAIAIHQSHLMEFGELEDSSFAPDYEPKLWNLAGSLSGAGRAEEALAAWEQLVDWAERIYADSPHSQIGYLTGLAQHQMDVQQFSAAEATLERVFQFLDEAAGDTRIGARLDEERRMAVRAQARWVSGTGRWTAAAGLITERVAGDTALLAEAVLWVAEEEQFRGRWTGAMRVLSNEASRLRRIGGQLDPQLWNNLCWQGALAGQATVVMPACDRAVAEATPENVPRNRDSRGLARALTGDLDGAADDIEFYVEYRVTQPEGEEFVATRRTWIPQLRAGTNPFTEEVIAELRD